MHEHLTTPLIGCSNFEVVEFALSITRPRSQEVIVVQESKPLNELTFFLKDFIFLCRNYFEAII